MVPYINFQNKGCTSTGPKSTASGTTEVYCWCSMLIYYPVYAANTTFK